MRGNANILIRLQLIIRLGKLDGHKDDVVEQGGDNLRSLNLAMTIEVSFISLNGKR